MNTKVLKVYGIVSEGCIDAIKFALSSVRGINEVTVSLLRSRVIVHCEPGRADNMDIAGALLAAGYIPCDIQNCHY